MSSSEIYGLELDDSNRCAHGTLVSRRCYMCIVDSLRDDVRVLKENVSELRQLQGLEEQVSDRNGEHNGTRSGGSDSDTASAAVTAVPSSVRFDASRES